jgi:homoserine kinase
LLTAAFCLQRYEMLPGLFGDHLHQPYRARLLPALPEVIAAAEKAGALGGFLSGSGSTMMAVTLSHPEKVAAAMRRVADRLKVSAETLILKADNAGYVIR